MVLTPGQPSLNRVSLCYIKASFFQIQIVDDFLRYRKDIMQLYFSGYACEHVSEMVYL